MELKDFITSTLTQIVDGIRAAQQETMQTEGCLISPSHTQTSPVSSKNIEGYDTLECVEFDVAVTTSTTVEGDAKAKVLVAGANIHGEHNRENVSRVKFPVYVQWPRQHKW